MPKGDKNGPTGNGSMTGRGMGYCGGYNSPGYMNSCCGRNFGAGRRFWNVPKMIQPEKELTQKELLEELKNEKAEIDKAIKELEQKKK